MVCLGVVLQRDVLVGDIASVASALGAPLPGYHNGVSLLMGGHRDVHIFDHTMQSPDVKKDDDPTKVWLPFAPGVPETPISVEFGCRDGVAPLTADEVQRVLEVVCMHFGAAPAVVMNRAALGGATGPVRTDSVEDINVFYGFDVAQAVGEFTVAASAWPDEEPERLFACWRCHRYIPASGFYRIGYGPGTGPFYHLLGNRVLGKSDRCCKSCTALVTEAPH
jgi:hypothetical protein